MVIWGFCVSTILVYHCTFSVNSIAHLWGTQRYNTKEESKNPAFIFLGAGDKKIPEGEYIALSRSDSKVRELPESYYNAHPGVYIRAVNPISEQASKSNLSEKAIERLKTLGYIK